MPVWVEEECLHLFYRGKGFSKQNQWTQNKEQKHRRTFKLSLSILKMTAAPTSNSETVMALPNLLMGFAINEQPATSKQHLTESILGVGECWWFDWRGRSSSPSGLELLAALASLWDSIELRLLVLQPSVVLLQTSTCWLRHCLPGAVIHITQSQQFT